MSIVWALVGAAVIFSGGFFFGVWWAAVHVERQIKHINQQSQEWAG